MIGQQGFHLGPLHRIRAAGPVQKRGAFLRRVLLQRLEEDLLLRTGPDVTESLMVISCRSCNGGNWPGKTRQRPKNFIYH